ncbi:MAG: hypothetical protein M9950_04795 [Thermomicrobiales bacterium]|nr:hypothetical protein [Thermomicrobiales bacterium]
MAAACTAIEHDPVRSYDLTCRGNTVALISDGSDLFGSTGAADPNPLAELPAAEGKSVIFKTFAGVDAFPVMLNTTRIDEIVETGVALAPTFGAICLDDIASPRAFTIAETLERAANIPVFSNQHHGTGVMVLGALYNALKVVGKRLEDVHIVLSGAGIAGIGAACLLTWAGARNLVVCDRAGAIYNYRPDRMNWAKACRKRDQSRGTQGFVGRDDGRRRCLIGLTRRYRHRSDGALNGAGRYRAGTGDPDTGDQSRSRARRWCPRNRYRS